MAKEKDKRGWLARLLDMDDNTVSASTVFLLVTTIVAIILLIVPAIALLVEVFYNHTISSDLSGMAAYIGAVAGIFASGGILKGWTNYSNYRYSNSESKEALKKMSEAVQKQIIDSIDASTQDEVDMYDNIEENMEDDYECK